MTTTTVDLTDVAGLEAAWNVLERIRELRLIDPELRADMYRCAEERIANGSMTTEENEELHLLLQEYPPAVVLEQWWEQLMPPYKPETGLLPSPMPSLSLRDPLLIRDEWFRADPQRLAAFVREMSHATTDPTLLAEAALALALSLGIAHDVAMPIVAAALRDLRTSKRNHD